MVRVRSPKCEKEEFMHKNPVAWWELASTDAEKTVEFLKKAFEWEMEFDASFQERMTAKLGGYPFPGRNAS